MSRRDDDDEHDHVYGNGRTARMTQPSPPSGQTMVGLGSVETSKRIDATRDVGDGPPTPPSGIPAVLARADVSLIVERVRTVEEKVDALITDSRSEHAKAEKDRHEMATVRGYWKRLSDTSAAHTQAVKDIQKDIASIKGDLAEMKGGALAHAAEMATYRKALIELDSTIGRPAENYTPPRASQIKDLTRAELEEQDRAAREGTGLHRSMAMVISSVAPFVQQTAQDAHAAKEAAEKSAEVSKAAMAETKASANQAVQKSAATAGGIAIGGLTIVQIAQSLLQSGNERLVAGAAVVLTLVGLVEAARRRFWRK